MNEMNMTVFKCICMHEYMYVCMHVLYSYIRVCMHLCVYACMYICMHVCINVCIYVIFKLGFERYRGIVLVGRRNCPGGELSGGKCPGGGNCPGEVSVPQSLTPFGSQGSLLSQVVFFV